MPLKFLLLDFPVIGQTIVHLRIPSQSTKPQLNFEPTLIQLRRHSIFGRMIGITTIFSFLFLQLIMELLQITQVELVYLLRWMIHKSQFQVILKVDG